MTWNATQDEQVRDSCNRIDMEENIVMPGAFSQCPADDPEELIL
jgi:hypothetical protein